MHCMLHYQVCHSLTPQIYERGADFKLNEVIEIIGVLSLTPELVSFDQEMCAPLSAFVCARILRLCGVVL